MNLHILPSVFLNMDEQERAFVVASVRLKVEAEKKEQRRLEHQAHAKR